MRASAVVVACLLGAWCARASADAIATNVRDLAPSTKAAFKVRLAATLALGKSKDGRAVIAVSDALEHDDDATIRRVAALALIKMIDESTEADALSIAMASLNSAAATDPDPKVREASTRTAATVKGYVQVKKTPKSSGSSGSSAGKPAVFVNIETVTDQSKKLSTASAARLQSIVQKDVAATGYSTSWPGGLPTQAQLGNARAYIVASTVKTLDIASAGHTTNIGCTVAIRVSPWGGKDGGERWEANKSASASGSAKVTTGSGPKDIEGGVHDCIEAVGEDITNRQVVPFLKKLVTSI
jgi:hypothetical protein